MADYFLLLSFVLMYVFPFSITQSTSCSPSDEGDIRLYNTRTGIVEDGSVQICYSGTWRAVCDYGWDCREANVACRQLGYYKARSRIRNSDGIFGYWSYIRNYYYSCSGSQTSLTNCSSYQTNWYQSCSTYSDEAGVRCVKTSSILCSHNGSLRLTGGSTDDEGVLEYCYNGNWSPFCNLQDEEAAVACKQLGYSQYAGFLSSDEYTWNFPTNYTGSMFNYFSCSSSATESSLSQCSLYTRSSSSCGVACQHPKAIKCHRTNQCTDGAIRLTDGSIAQEGRVEVCVNGVWGSVCGSGLTRQAAFVACKQLGYIYSEPVIYTNSKYGNGKLPIVYSNIQCQGWERSISECTKTNYLQFSCSVTAGVLCPDDCTNGEVRLVGGETSNEGTVEICMNSLWGLISDAGWHENDAKVICRQLNQSFDGAQPMYNSHYGKPDRAIHYSYVLCDGDESSVTSCDKITHTLVEGRQIFLEAVVAGVVCRHAQNVSKPICLPIPEEAENKCTIGELSIDEQSGMIQYCVNGAWSSICHMTHNETTVACRQLGYTTLTWGLPYDIESVSSSQDVSLISNISCISTEDQLSKCTVNKQEHCMKYCSTVLGLNCYKPGKCPEGSIRLADGIIEQEGRVEVCVNGVWGSICDDGWDTTDAHVVCQQLGYSNSKPLAFKGDHFGSSSGPLLYSDVQCGGWENSIEECRKKSHLEIQCSHKTVAGVTCSDGCSDGSVRLVGSEYEYKGTVEVCYDNLWGLVEEDGWGLSDAAVVCQQLGFQQAKNATTGSLFGKPNKVIHIGRVKCDGSETSINQCSKWRYTVEKGKGLILTVEVAGVICYTPKTLSTDNKLSTTTTSSQHLVTTQTMSNKPRSSVATFANNDNSSISQLIVVLIGLVCFLIVLVVAISTIYWIYNSRKTNSHQQTPSVMTMTKIMQHSGETSGDDNKEMQTNIRYMDNERSLMKEEEMDTTIRPISGDYEPMYEECSAYQKE